MSPRSILVALMQTGFGAFLSVYLTTHGWTGAEFGFALSVSAMAAIGIWYSDRAILILDAAFSTRAGAGVPGGIPLWTVLPETRHRPHSHLA